MVAAGAMVRQPQLANQPVPHLQARSRHSAFTGGWHRSLCEQARSRPALSKGLGTGDGGCAARGSLGRRTWAPRLLARRWRGPRQPCGSAADEEVSVEEEVEEEEEEEDAMHEAHKVDAETSNKDLDLLLNQLDKGRINLEPQYQRQYIWPKEKAYRLVETVFARLFIPAVVLHTNPEGVHDVVDGKQRLTTLRHFREGFFPDGSEFKLQGLTMLAELNGMTYAKLPECRGFPTRRHFDDYPLTVTLFKESTSEEAVLRVYEDLNCGGENLNKQQVRRAVFVGPYISLLDQLALNETFQRLLGRKGKDPSEKDVELILRFFALWRRGPRMFAGSMEKYLTRELAEHRQMGCEGPDSEGQRLRQLFEATVELVHSVYGDGAFRRWSGRGYKKQITPGLYDSIMQTVAQKVSEKDANWMRRVKAAKHELREDLKQLCQDQAFVAQLRAFSAKRLVARLDAYQRKVEAVLDKFGRTFPYADKLAAELYASQGQKCAICCHHMDDISHTQLDHIVPYSKGGASYPSNAQLVHRECNLAKGPKMEG